MLPTELRALLLIVLSKSSALTQAAARDHSLLQLATVPQIRREACRGGLTRAAAEKPYLRARLKSGL